MPVLRSRTALGVGVVDWQAAQSPGLALWSLDRASSQSRTHLAVRLRCSSSSCHHVGRPLALPAGQQVGGQRGQGLQVRSFWRLLLGKEASGAIGYQGSLSFCLIDASLCKGACVAGWGA